MNFDEAITAHANWKTKLKTYIQRPDGSIDPAVLSRNDQCVLGKWINDAGKEFSHLPEYKELHDTHTKFHKAAGDIVHRCNRGESVSSEVSLGSDSDFTNHSKKIVGILMKMKTIVK